MRLPAFSALRATATQLRVELVDSSSRVGMTFIADDVDVVGRCFTCGVAGQLL
jgi:hypothetical protein